MPDRHHNYPDISAPHTDSVCASHVGGTLSPAEARSLLEKRNVPDQIRQHGEAVGYAARRLAETLNQAGYPCDIDTVHAAGIVHDICKGMRRHEQEAGILFRQLGLPRMAELVENHQAMSVADDEPFSEAELIFLADKLIQGTTIVPVQSRYDHKMQLYADNPEALATVAARREDALRSLHRFERLSGKNAEEIIRAGSPADDRSSPHIAVLIPAAGFSSRMGQFKPLLPFAEGTVLQHIVDTWRSCGVHDLLAVSGHRAEELEQEAARLNIRTVRNTRPEDGMFSSIRLGLSDLCTRSYIDWIAVHPADIPLVDPRSLVALIETASTRHSGVICPMHKGQKGHPPLLHRSVAKQVTMWSGEDGLRGALRDITTTYVDITDAGVLHDMDFPKEYEEALRRLKQQSADSHNS